MGFNGKNIWNKGAYIRKARDWLHKYARESSLHNVCEKADHMYSMSALRSNKTQFKYFPYALEAIDVTFQEANRPSGNMQEGKKYFSGKHKLYGFKTEVTVRPNGIAVACSQHFPGSVSDLHIMQRMSEAHEDRLEKRDGEQAFSENEILHQKYENYRAALVDKGYQGAAEFLRVILPKKKPASGILSKEDTLFNKKVAADFIIVENYFGRMGNLWGVISLKYKWNDLSYDMIFRCCLALTNVHVRHIPLSADDSDWYNQYRNLLVAIGE